MSSFPHADPDLERLTPEIGGWFEKHPWHTYLAIKENLILESYVNGYLYNH